MALCDSCVFYKAEYDEFRKQYDDALVDGVQNRHHYCPMYDDHIPDKVFYRDGDCEWYDGGK